jgi:hypothetical protein
MLIIGLQVIANFRPGNDFILEHPPVIWMSDGVNNNYYGCSASLRDVLERLVLIGFSEAEVQFAREELLLAEKHHATTLQSGVLCLDEVEHALALKRK